MNHREHIKTLKEFRGEVDALLQKALANYTRVVLQEHLGSDHCMDWEKVIQGVSDLRLDVVDFVTLESQENCRVVIETPSVTRPTLVK